MTDAIDDRLMRMAQDRTTNVRLEELARKNQARAAQDVGLGKARPVNGMGAAPSESAVDRVAKDVLARKPAPGIGARPVSESIGRAAGKAYKFAGGGGGALRTAGKMFAPALAAYDTATSDYGVTPNADNGMAGNIGSMAANAGVKAGEWGTRGLDLLTTMPINAVAGIAGKGQAIEPFNDIYRRQLEGRNIGVGTIGDRSQNDSMTQATPNTAMAQQPTGAGVAPTASPEQQVQPTAPQSISSTLPAGVRRNEAGAIDSRLVSSAYDKAREQPGMRNAASTANLSNLEFASRGMNVTKVVDPKTGAVTYHDRAANPFIDQTFTAPHLGGAFTGREIGAKNQSIADLNAQNAQLESLRRTGTKDDIARNVAAQGIESNRQALADTRKTASIRDKYLETLTPEQQAQALGFGAKPKDSKGYSAVTRKIYDKEGYVIGEEPVIYSQDTGQSVNQQAQQNPQQQAQQKVKYGDVVDGYKYIGGDPSKPTSWVKA